MGVMAALALAACSSTPGGSKPGSTTASGPALRGGTAYFAEEPLTPPTYIFPLVSGAYFTVENTSDFQTLMYEPLYRFGDKGSATVDYRLSIGNAPLYSDGNRVVTITLKGERWSDEQAVSARDVIFWINLLKANRDEWASYVPGGFPDNVVTATAVNSTTVRLRLNAGYNPTWYTYNELSQITPLPMAWDRTSLSSPAPGPTSSDLPDTTTTGAKEVYNFLNNQARAPSTYASSPIWSVVDGPWRLASLTTDGRATFVPNKAYSGLDKPHLAQFVELPFTSAEAEFSVLRAGPASGGAGSPGDQISVGYVPDSDLPESRTIRAQGYQLINWFPFQFDYFEPNFNNPKVGPILRQLYFRQAFQHLVDQGGWIRAYYNGLGVPTYSPVPASPKNPYSNSAATENPYPFSIPAAKALRLAHRAERRHDVRTAGDQPGGLRPRHRGWRGSQLHAHVPERPRLHRQLDGQPPINGERGGHRDRLEGGHADHDRIDDPALYCIPACLQLAARPVRDRMAVRAGPLPERGGDLPEGRARQRGELLQHRGRQADQGDNDRLGRPRPGGAQCLRQ